MHTCAASFMMAHHAHRLHVVHLGPVVAFAADVKVGLFVDSAAACAGLAAESVVWWVCGHGCGE